MFNLLAISDICYEKSLECGHFLTSCGKLFHTRYPEYLKLCLKYSVLGLGGTKQPAVDDLKSIVVLIALFRGVKFSVIYVGVILLATLYINLAFLR